MNPNFVKYIERMDQVRSGVWWVDPLTAEEQAEIETAADEHAKQHVSGKIGIENICAIHPYFLQLEWKWAEFDMELMGLKRDDRPTETLERILRNVDRGKYSTVLFDDYSSYVYKSHELAEEGVIDKVIFTHFQNGVAINKEDMRDFSSSKQNYVGGAVAHQCVQETIKEIRSEAPYLSIRPIRDAISYHEPKLWHKAINWTLYSGALLSNGRKAIDDNKFRFLARSYNLVRGVDSTYLLRPNMTDKPLAV